MKELNIANHSPLENEETLAGQSVASFKAKLREAHALFHGLSDPDNRHFETMRKFCADYESVLSDAQEKLKILDGLYNLVIENYDELLKWLW
jgi:hypothetical protein